MRGAPILQRLLRSIADLMRAFASALDGVASGPRARARDLALAALGERFPQAPDHWLRVVAQRAPDLAEAEAAQPEPPPNDLDPLGARRGASPLKLAWWPRRRVRPKRWPAAARASETAQPAWTEPPKPDEPCDWPPGPERTHHPTTTASTPHDRLARPALRLVPSPEARRAPLSFPNPAEPQRRAEPGGPDGRIPPSKEHPAFASPPDGGPRRILAWPDPAARASRPGHEAWAPLHDTAPAHRLGLAGAPRHAPEPWVTTMAEPPGAARLALADARHDAAPSTPWAEPPSGRSHDVSPTGRALDPRWPRLPSIDAESVAEAPAAEVGRHVREQELGAWSG